MELIETGVGQGSVIGPLLFLIAVICVSQVLKRAKKILQEEYNIKMITRTDIYVKNSEDHQCYTKSNSFTDDLTATIAMLTEEQNKIVLRVLQELYIQYFAEVGLKVNIDKNEHEIKGLILANPAILKPVLLDNWFTCGSLFQPALKVRPSNLTLSFSARPAI